MLGTKNQFQTNLFFATVALLSKNSIPFLGGYKIIIALNGDKTWFALA